MNKYTFAVPWEQEERRKISGIAYVEVEAENADVAFVELTHLFNDNSEAIFHKERTTKVIDCEILDREYFIDDARLKKCDTDDAR
jgi:hypothetical protein